MIPSLRPDPARAGVAVVLVLSAASAAGCYSSARSARVSQTLDSAQWTCLADPVVSCPGQPGGECSGWDERWLAVCPDDGSRWVCRFDRVRIEARGTSGGRRVFCGRQDAADPAGDASEPAAEQSRAEVYRTGSEAATVPPDPRGREALAARAAEDHECTAERVSVDADHTEQQGSPAYWITVCGVQRFYRFDAMADRFVDVTPQSSSPQPRAPSQVTPRAEPSHVEVRTDEFRGTQTVQFTSGVLWEQPNIPPARLYVFVRSATTARMAISLRSPEWRWLRCHSIELLVDGEPIPLAESMHEGDVERSGGVSELVSVALPDGFVNRLDQVQNLRARVCRDVFILSPASLADLRRVPSLVAGLTSPP